MRLAFNGGDSIKQFIIIIVMGIILSACSQEELSTNEEAIGSYKESSFNAKISEIKSVSDENNEEAINLNPQFIILYITMDIEAIDPLQIDQEFYNSFSLEEENEPIPVKPFIDQLSDVPKDMRIVEVKYERLEQGDNASIELAYVIEKGTEDYYLNIQEDSQIYFTANDIE
ncbi:hypothetical protein [Geomicrobium sediminis]|uniref:ABC-type enterochelin transport system substrate-binding protein n=1 Tax=Geomicrobium sediminis TaxID=1347788 RepID=A0ABS2PFU1_9BACL|nr:hypothetical protein [Geomicrobium sediminis]MBM7634297.1 ABC-type enterochelin transport system substrate-binding protein [Geomicrobium sediminis]